MCGLFKRHQLRYRFCLSSFPASIGPFSKKSKKKQQKIENKESRGKIKNLASNCPMPI